MKQLVKHPLEDFLLRNKFKNIEGDFWQHEVFGLLILNSKEQNENTVQIY